MMGKTGQDKQIQRKPRGPSWIQLAQVACALLFVSSLLSPVVDAGVPKTSPAAAKGAQDHAKNVQGGTNSASQVTQASQDIDLAAADNAANAIGGQVTTEVHEVLCIVAKTQTVVEVDHNPVTLKGCTDAGSPGNPVARLTYNVPASTFHNAAPSGKLPVSVNAGTGVVGNGGAGRAVAEVVVRSPAASAGPPPVISAATGPDARAITVTLSAPAAAVTEIQLRTATSKSGVASTGAIEAIFKPSDPEWSTLQWIHRDVTMERHYYMASYKIDDNRRVESNIADAMPLLQFNVTSTRGPDWIDVSWTPLRDATHYSVRRNGEGLGRVFEQVEEVTNSCQSPCTTPVTYHDAGLLAGEEHTYQIVAYGYGGAWAEGFATNHTYARPDPPTIAAEYHFHNDAAPTTPPAPPNPPFDAQPFHVHITITGPVETDDLPITGYTVYQNAGGSGTWSSAYFGTSTSPGLSVPAENAYGFYAVTHTAAIPASDGSNVATVDTTQSLLVSDPPQVSYHVAQTCLARTAGNAVVHISPSSTTYVKTATGQATVSTPYDVFDAETYRGTTRYYASHSALFQSAWAPAKIPDISPITNLLAAAEPDGSVSLNWTVPKTAAATGVAQYVVWKLSSQPSPGTAFPATPNPTGSLLHATAATPNTWTITIPASELLPGTDYDLLVAASTCLDEPDVAHWNMGQYVHVRTRDVPGQPDAPTVTSGNKPKDIVVDWDTPTTDGGSQIIRYELYRAPDGSDAFQPTAITGPVSPHTVVQERLDPYQTYCYKVRARNAVGPGLFSNVTCGRPAPELPGKPTIEAHTAPAPEAIDASWQPSTTGGSQSLKYDLFTAKTAAGPYMKLLDHSSFVELHDIGLGNGVTRFYYVVAFNEMGESPPSDVAYATTIDYPGAPLNLRAVGGNKSINLSWSAPSDGGSPILFYNITGTRLDAVGTYAASTNLTSKALTGLGYDESWAFKVSASNLLGAGPNATEKADTFGVPDPPAPVIGGFSKIRGRLDVKWLPPLDDGGYAVSKYSVYDVTTTSTFVTDKTSLSYNETGLGDGITKTFRVTAWNEAGQSDRSEPADATTPDRPSPPQRPAIKFATNATPTGDDLITFSWLDPASDGGLPVSQFDVYVSADNVTWVHDQTVVAAWHAAYWAACEDVICYYRVTATNEVGESDPSAVVSLELPPPFPPESIRGTTPGSGGEFQQTFDCGQPNQGSVNLVSGQFVQTLCLVPGSDDFPGLAMPVQVTHRANSREQGSAGRNWFLSVDRRLLFEDGGDAVLTDGSGRFDVFANLTDEYQSPPGFYMELAKSGGGYTLRHVGGITESFDADGLRTRIDDLYDNNVAFTYSGGDHVATMTDALGRVTTFNYEGHNLTRITDWSGRSANFTYAGKDLSQVSINGAQYNFTYRQHNLNTTTNARGDIYMQNHYDELWRVVNQTYAEGFYTFAYDYSLSTTKAEDPEGNLATWTYTSQEHPTPTSKIIEANRRVRDGDPLTMETKYQSNADLEITSVQDAEGIRTTYTYDSQKPDALAHGNLLKMQINPNVAGFYPLTYTWTYEPEYQQVKTETPPVGNDPSYQPSNGGAGGAARYTTWHCYGQDEVLYGDLNGNGAVAALGEVGRPVKFVEPAINAGGAPYAGLTADQKRITYVQYNVRGQPIQTTSPAGDVTRYSYYEPGQQGPNGENPAGTMQGETTYSSNSFDPVVSGGEECLDPPWPQPSGAGLSTNYTYDSRGYMTSQTEPNGMTTTWEHDWAGRTLSQTDASGSAKEYTYDADGNLLSEARSNARYGIDFSNVTEQPYVNRYAYDAVGRMTEEWLASNSSVDGSLHPETVNNRFIYDANGNMVAKIWQTYNAGGLHEDGVETYLYNERNQVVARTVGGKTPVFDLHNPGIVVPENEILYLRTPPPIVDPSAPLPENSPPGAVVVGAESGGGSVSAGCTGPEAGGVNPSETCQTSVPVDGPAGGAGAGVGPDGGSGGAPLTPVWVDPGSTVPSGGVLGDPGDGDGADDGSDGGPGGIGGVPNVVPDGLVGNDTEAPEIPESGPGELLEPVGNATKGGGGVGTCVEFDTIAVTTTGFSTPLSESQHMFLCAGVPFLLFLVGAGAGPGGAAEEEQGVDSAPGYSVRPETQNYTLQQSVKKHLTHDQPTGKNPRLALPAENEPVMYVGPPVNRTLGVFLMDWATYEVPPLTEDVDELDKVTLLQPRPTEKLNSTDSARVQLVFWVRGTTGQTIINNTWHATLWDEVNKTTPKKVADFTITFPPIGMNEVVEQRITLANDVRLKGPIAVGLGGVKAGDRLVLYDSVQTPTRLEIGRATTQTTDYNLNGQVIRSQDGDGRVTTYEYDPYGRQSTQRDMDGNLHVTTYDSAGSRWQEMYGSPDGTNNRLLLSKSIEHLDEGGRVFRTDVARFDPRTGLPLPDAGITPNDGYATTFYGYDADGRPTKRIGDDGTVQTRSYDHTGRVVEERDGSEAGIKYTWGENGTLDAVTATSIAANGVATPTNRTYLFSYDELSRLIRSVDPLGHARYMGYDSGGRLAWSTDSRGGPMPDMEGRYNGKITSAGNLVEYSYDGQGHLESTKRDLTDTGRGDGLLAGNVTTRQVWDSEGRLIQQISDGGQVTTYEYDVQGNLVKETSPTGIERRAFHDAAGHVVRVELPGATITQTFDNRGLLVHRDSSGSFSTRQSFVYDGLGRLVKATDNNYVGTNQDGSVVQFEYDSTGQILREIQNGVVVAAQHDGVGRPTELIYPSGLSIQRTYDAAGRPATVKAGAMTLATYGYAEGRLDTRTLGNGVVMDASYDAADHLTGLDVDSAEFHMGYQYAYDEDGRVTKSAVDHAPNTGHHASYDSLGRLTQYYAGNVDERIAAATRNVKSAGADSWDWTLDGQNNWLNVEQGVGINSTTTATAYNGENQGVTYGIDGNGTAFESNPYDARGNLLGSSSGNGTQANSYAYDAFNRLRFVVGQKIVARDVPEDCQLDPVPEDLNCSPTEAKPAFKVTYKYDALNRRTSMNTTLEDGNTTTPDPWQHTSFVYDGMNLIESQTTGNISATATRRFVHGLGIDDHIAMNNGTAWHYYVQDRLGNVMALTDATGALSEAYLYQAYGGLTVVHPGANGVIDWGQDDTTNSTWTGFETASAIGNPFYYTGQQFDANTGLYYYRARYYDPADGRFLSADPIGVWGDGQNLGNGYAYVGNGPLYRTDPWGLFNCTDGAVNQFFAGLTLGASCLWNDGGVIDSASAWVEEHSETILKVAMVAGAIAIMLTPAGPIIMALGPVGAAMLSGAAAGVLIQAGIDCLTAACGGSWQSYAGAAVSGAVFAGGDKVFKLGRIGRTFWGSLAGGSGELTAQALGECAIEWDRVGIASGLGAAGGYASKLKHLNQGKYNLLGRWNGVVSRGDTPGAVSYSNLFVGGGIPHFLQNGAPDVTMKLAFGVAC